MRLDRLQLSILLVGLLLTACTPLSLTPVDGTGAVGTDKFTVQALNTSSDCEKRFVVHSLPFATGTRIREIRTYESNGAGLSINDLDGDGELDIVFASIDREAAILWNQGDLTFDMERLDARFTRGVNTVDVDGDGWFDIVFTHRGLQPISYWHNQDGSQSRRAFVGEQLSGVDSYAYSMAWADMTADNKLDLVTGSYNVDLRQNGTKEPGDEPNAGVFVYIRHGERFLGHQLTTVSEALSVALVDLNADHRLDIWVANDFDIQDQVWVAAAEDWLPATPFSTTSFSTMSIEWGDIENSGKLALFTTDMMPYDDSPETNQAWQPLMDDMMARYAHTEGDPQVMANVLLVSRDTGSWDDVASEAGIAATGWSWASKFGDLDNDGFLDLYVVNGMIAENMLGHLPNGELVEENQAFHNRGNGRFEPVPSWGLNAKSSGRGMVMADMDRDGDLDIVVSNLRQPALLFENRLCGGDGLIVELSWPDSGNSHAIGAQLILQTSFGELSRDVRASGGYLSGESRKISHSRDVRV